MRFVEAAKELFAMTVMNVPDLDLLGEPGARALERRFAAAFVTPREEPLPAGFGASDMSYEETVARYLTVYYAPLIRGLASKGEGLAQERFDIQFFLGETDEEVHVVINYNPPSEFGQWRKALSKVVNPKLICFESEEQMEVAMARELEQLLEIF